MPNEEQYEIEFCVKRTQRVHLIGSTGVRTHLDESRQIVWINLNDLIDDLGISLTDELEYFKSDGGLELAKSLQIHTQTHYPSMAEPETCMYIPHYNINDYLYNISTANVKPDVYGNIDCYRQSFAVEVDRFWRDFSKTTASAADLDLRRQLWIRDRDKVTIVGNMLVSRKVVKTVDAFAGRLREFAFRLLNRPVGPTSSLRDNEFDFYRIIESSYLNIVRNHILNGGNPDMAMKTAETALTTYLKDAFVVLRH